MIRPACTLLVFSALASAALAQSSDQVFFERHRIIIGWARVVSVAESKYRSKYGVYGDLTALRDAHLLNNLTFESENPKKTEPGANFIPKRTQFEVTASDDGKQRVARLIRLACSRPGITALFPLKQHENCRISTRAFVSNRYKTLVTGFSMTNLSVLRQSSSPSYDRWSHLVAKGQMQRQICTRSRRTRFG